ncbi:MAG: NAD(P)/FAD-dependent oxidoreductase [Methyloligellaceae bacterium]
MNRQNIAVVGTGIAGLSAAWLLSQRHAVTVFERDGRLGGHSHTVDVAAPEGPCPVDTGFIVYNPPSYPNLVALFEHLDVPTAATQMTFSVSLDGGRYEYSGSGLFGLMGQRRNVVSLRHWTMIADLLRFFRAARVLIERAPSSSMTLGAFVEREGFSKAFIDNHILPVGAAIWSAPPQQILSFPALSFVRFFANHGLLKVRDRPAWRTVRGGSREYVRRLREAVSATFHVGTAVARITRRPGGVIIADSAGRQHRFDQVVIGAHADDALKLLTDADPLERRLLGAFGYASNRVVLHTDPRLMPHRRRIWSSWNYLGEHGDGDRRVSATYWMNSLQPLATARDYFVTLNPVQPIDPEHVHGEFGYRHPLFDQAAIDTQSELWRLQGGRRTWFCGSYFGYGFHEDGLQSGLAVGEQLGGVRRPWRVADESGRIRLPVGERAIAFAEAAA